MLATRLVPAPPGGSRVRRAATGRTNRLAVASRYAPCFGGAKLCQAWCPVVFAACVAHDIRCVHRPSGGQARHGLAPHNQGRVSVRRVRTPARATPSPRPGAHGMMSPMRPGAGGRHEAIPARSPRSKNHPVRRGAGELDYHTDSGAQTARGVMQWDGWQRSGTPRSGTRGSKTARFAPSPTQSPGSEQDAEPGSATRKMRFADVAAVALTARGFYKHRKKHPSQKHHGTKKEALTHPEKVLDQLQRRLVTRDTKHILRLFGEWAGHPSKRVVPISTFRRALRGIFAGITDAQADEVRPMCLARRLCMSLNAGH